MVHLLSRHVEVVKNDSVVPCFIESFHSKKKPKLKFKKSSFIITRIEGIAFCFFPQLNQVSPQQTDVIEHHYRVYERLQKIRAETEEVGALFECCYGFVYLFRCL